jgi:hypothetical protein
MGSLGTDRAAGGSSGCSTPISGGDGGAFGASGSPAEIIGEDGASGGGGVSGGGGGGGVGYLLVWATSLTFQGTPSPAHERVPPL